MIGIIPDFFLPDFEETIDLPSMYALFSSKICKLARTVDVYARRPQIQERLTVQIADALERTLNPKGIMVMLEAEHTCMTMRGIKKPGSKTITTVTRGDFKTDRELQKQFLSMVKD